MSHGHVRLPVSLLCGVFIVWTATAILVSCSAGAHLSNNPPSQDFTLSVSPSMVTATGGGADPSFTVSVTGLNGFAGLVSISISGTPSGAVISPASPFHVDAGTSQNVSISASSVASGNYNLTVSGTAGALTHSAAVALAVTANPAQDFSLSLAPTPLTATAGSSNATFTAAVNGLNGFTGTVSISLSGLPNGATTLPPSPFNVTAGSSQPVTVSVPISTLSDEYNITATGKASLSGGGGTVVHAELLDLMVLGQSQVTTWHYDNFRRGANLNETTLSPANVNSAHFGLLGTLPVDGFIVGHPLYVPGVQTAGGIHNVIYVATMHDSVYAFDADSLSPAPLWMVSLLSTSGTGAVPTPGGVKLVTNTTGWSEVGIASTPVIDPATNTIFLLAETYENNAQCPLPAGPCAVVHRIHALDVASGAERPASPVTVAGSYTVNGGTTVFKDLYQLNRPGLLLTNGHIYAAFGSNCCNQFSQGWIFSYNASTLQQEGAYTVAPNHTLASIWQKGGGLTADEDGNIYAETGESSLYVPGQNLPISVVKVGQSGTTLTIKDYFTPFNYSTLSSNDKDLSNSVVLLPDQLGASPHEAVTVGKEGTIYLLNRNNLGQLCPNCTASDTQIVQEIQLVDRFSSTPVYWNGTVYFTGVNDPVTAYALNNGMLALPPMAQSAPTVGPSHPIITANGNLDGILWYIDNGRFLVALDAVTLSTLYRSDQAANGRDSLPRLAHFASPIEVNGKIFIGTQNSVAIYGLLP